MLVVGCTSVLRVAHKYTGALAEWIVAMRARKPERVVAVALANKLAKIAWAMMSTAKPSEPNFTRRPDDKETLQDRRFSFEEIGKRNDVMNDTVATKAQDTLTSATSHELAVGIGTKVVGYHQGQRSQTAPKAGHMTAADQRDQSVETHLPRGRPHMADAVEAARRTCSRKRRMNSAASSVMVLSRSWRLIR